MNNLSVDSCYRLYKTGCLEDINENYCTDDYIFLLHGVYYQTFKSSGIRHLGHIIDICGNYQYLRAKILGSSLRHVWVFPDELHGLYLASNRALFNELYGCVGQDVWLKC